MTEQASECGIYRQPLNGLIRKLMQADHAYYRQGALKNLWLNHWHGRSMLLPDRSRQFV